MLGPELINLTPRPTPIFLEGSASIQLNQQAAKDLGLKDGQIVQGVIATRGDMLKLILNNKELDWSASGRFKPGDKLDFRVETSIFGRSLVPLGRTAAVGSSTAPPALSPRLLSLMHRPEQPSVLASLFKQGGLDAIVAQLSGSEQQMRANLLHSMARLSPQAVKQALINSGLFGESRLVGATPVQIPDIKQMLRMLLRMIPVKSAITADLERAVDEIESKQLDSLQGQQSRELGYSFVLPFMDANPVEIELYREPLSSSIEGEEWVINLHTESRHLGELWLKTTLKSAASVEMIMWAPFGDVAQRAQEAASELEYELERFGLGLAKFDVLSAPRPSSSEATGGSGQVVDIST